MQVRHRTSFRFGLLANQFLSHKIGTSGAQRAIPERITLRLFPRPFKFQGLFFSQKSCGEWGHAVRHARDLRSIRIGPFIITAASASLTWIVRKFWHDGHAKQSKVSWTKLRQARWCYWPWSVFDSTSLSEEACPTESSPMRLCLDNLVSQWWRLQGPGSYLHGICVSYIFRSSIMRDHWRDAICLIKTITRLPA